MALDAADPRPAYQQIADDLRRFIASEEAQVGDKLPSLTELQTKYGRAVMTLQKALDVLRAEGLVLSRQGEGTIIVKKPEAHAGEEEGPSPHELRQMFERINSALDDLSQRVSAVEAELFGSTSDDPQSGSTGR
ncbi:DNA-binding GntR family transcriptional regulator [Saccharothrix coeruleofusca]|uniref:GntR family transcriptional regulator n=1 Tax=Saccharothrix coeruleofusca TaxID=33919 RepID=UPI001AE2801D|nr:GntR family transcriptional regulator [Saccharothrix coeruleofusca]MBP2339040.1 DNA-binding GntR family transcriptional regulator [Saccharothrix coeruleofusca]